MRTHAESELFALKKQRTGSPRRLSPPPPVPDRRQQAPLENVQGLHIRLTRLSLPRRFIPSPFPPAYLLERSTERVEIARREPMSSADPVEGSSRWTSTVRHCLAPPFSNSDLGPLRREWFMVHPICLNLVNCCADNQRRYTAKDCTVDRFQEGPSLMKLSCFLVCVADGLVCSSALNNLDGAVFLSLPSHVRSARVWGVATDSSLRPATIGKVSI